MAKVRAIAVRLLALASLAAVLRPARAMLAHRSDPAIVLNRYGYGYSALLSLYGVLIVAWVSLTIWALWRPLAVLDTVSTVSRSRRRLVVLVGLATAVAFREFQEITDQFPAEMTLWLTLAPLMPAATLGMMRAIARPTARKDPARLGGHFEARHGYPWTLIIAAVGWAISGLVFWVFSPLRGSLASVSLVMGLLLLLPGFMVIALLCLHVSDSPWGVMVASFGVSAGITMTLAFAVRQLAQPPATMGRMLWLLEVPLLALLVVQWRRGRLRVYDFSARSRRAKQADLIVCMLLVPVLCAHLLETQYRVRDSDVYVYLSYIGWMVSHPALPYQPPTLNQKINPRLMSSGWLATQAAITDLAKVDTNVLYVFQRHMPLGLILVSVAAVYALACELFDRPATRVASVTAYIVYLFATLPKTWEELAGFTIFYRTSQDKVLAAHTLVPVTALLMLRYMRRQQVAYLPAIGLSGAATSLAHPLGLPFVALVVGAYGFLTWIVHPSRKSLITVALIVVVLLPSVALPLMQRGEQGAPLTLQDDEAFARREHLVEGRLLIFSREDNDFISHPLLVSHPLVELGILIGLGLGLRFRQRRDARFLFATTAGPLLIMYTPGVAPLAGRFVTPYLLWRFLWLLPIGLSLGWGLDYLARWATTGLAGSSRALSALATVSFLLVAYWGLALPQSIAHSVSWIHVDQDEGEKQLLHVMVCNHISELLDDGETVLAPADFNKMIVALVPDARTVAWVKKRGEEALYQQIEDFYSGSRLDATDIDLLKRFDVDYVIVPHDAPVSAHIQQQACFDLVQSIDGVDIYSLDVRRGFICP